MTAFDAICERVASLDAGADDCLVNPADNDEIAARLRALLRRPGRDCCRRSHVGGLVFDVAARRLHHHDVEVPLTHKEAELLELLMRRAGTVVRKSVITDALYGSTKRSPRMRSRRSSRACATRSARPTARRTASRCSIPSVAWDTCCANSRAAPGPTGHVDPSLRLAIVSDAIPAAEQFATRVAGLKIRYAGTLCAQFDLTTHLRQNGPAMPRKIQPTLSLSGWRQQMLLTFC